MRHLAACIIKVTVWSTIVMFVVWVSLTVIVEMSNSEVPTGKVHDAKQISQINWKSLDLYHHVIPAASKLAASTITGTSGFVTTEGRQVYYREYLPPATAPPTGVSLLLLHGRSFSSATWAKLGTLSLMAALGHRVLAVDLPGFGLTGGEAYAGNRADFLLNLISELAVQHPVLVTPSMSGSYALPFLASNPELLSGLVTVAPTSTNVVPQDTLKLVKVPTLAVLGSDDDTGLAQQSSLNLQVLPNLVEVELAGASHAAYMSQPDLFHAALYNFLLALNNVTST